jgi:hypothetical protein
VKISYSGGQLKIDVVDSTLGGVLAQVAALTGVKIDVPAAANSERLPVVDLGPEPARQVIASLLSASEFDYLIAASDTDPEKVQSVVLMARQKGSGSNGTEGGGNPFRSQYARGGALPPSGGDAPDSDSPVAAEPDNTAAEANSLPPAATPQNDSAPAAPAQSNQPGSSPSSPAAFSNRSGLTSDGAMNPPSSMDQQSVNQQLQQMYQQRMQMTQQEKSGPTAPPGAAANPASP